MNSSSPAELSVDEIQMFLDNYSDFAFEVSVLNRLRNAGFDCLHSGTYEDPLKQKVREFDIRATYEASATATLRLAVECKNLRKDFPLLIHRLPRRSNEAWMDVVWSFDDRGSTPPFERGRAIRLSDSASPYSTGDFVGKATDQIRRKGKSDLSSNDSGVFEKIAQALNSAYDLLHRAHYSSLEKHAGHWSIVIPVLVVPNGSLWVADYGQEGTLLSPPYKTSHVQYFVGREYQFGGTRVEVTRNYSLSHIEICEPGQVSQVFSAFIELVKRHGA